MARYGFSFFDSGVRFDAPDAHPTHMIQLTRLLENPFDDSKISIPELLSFTTDHIQRMIANNPSNELDARIAATQSSLTLVMGTVTDDATKLAIRMARTQAKDNFRAALPGKVAQIAGAVTAKYGADSEQMTECFPQGRKVFSDSTEDQVANHLQTLINGLTEYQAALGAQPLADATALLTGWNAVHDAKGTAAGAKTATQDDKRNARENLQLMLFLNLIKLAEMFARQPEKLALYMRQSLLEDHPQHPPTPPPPTP